MKWLLALMLLSAQPTFASELHCEGDDFGYYWTYDITLEDGHADIIYKFRDWVGEYVAVVIRNRFKVPSPHEFEKNTFLEKTANGWELKFYEFDGAPSPYFPDDFFCIEN